MIIDDITMAPTYNFIFLCPLENKNEQVMYQGNFTPQVFVVFHFNILILSSLMANILLVSQKLGTMNEKLQGKSILWC